MRFNPKPIRIEPAFDNREEIRAMLDRQAPYRAIAAYAPAFAAYDPDGLVDNTREEAKRPVLPWFRGNWALGGKPLVEGAELILHNKRFLETAKAASGSSLLCPEFVVVNINAPMPAGKTHVDVPSFHGATRENYPLPFLHVMRNSGLFEAWRVVHAEVISWFYEGVGGNFDYWPEGLDGPMLSEPAPFGNVALMADNDRMYHRIGRVGDPKVLLPDISAAATIQPDGDGNWVILENGDVRATYPSQAIRFSVLWKAEVRDGELKHESLTLDRIMAIFTADLRHRRVDFQVPPDPLTDPTWTLLLERIYADPTDPVGSSMAIQS